MITKTCNQLLRIAQKAKDQGLAEGCTAQGGGTLHKLRRLGSRIDRCGQNLAHSTGNLWYGGRHGEAPFRDIDVGCDNHIMPQGLL